MYMGIATMVLKPLSNDIEEGISDSRSNSTNIVNSRIKTGSCSCQSTGTLEISLLDHANRYFLK
jgi:hypothetical protein